MRTYQAKVGEVGGSWHLVDASNQVVGRLATQIATLLRGKHSPKFTHHVDTGDFVIVVNADKVKFTGDKWDQKKYRSYSGYMGGLKTTTASEMLKKKPEEIIKKAVRGMMPKNSLNTKMISKLKVYAGPEHPHASNSPQPFKLKG